MSASGEVEGSHAQNGASSPLARDGRPMRVISLRFPGSCRSCHGGLTVGMSAWWAKGEPPVCVDCAGVGEQERSAETSVALATDADVSHASEPDGTDPKSPLGRDGQPMRLIGLKFASVCRVCSTGLDAGSPAWWAKGESPICAQCGEADADVGLLEIASVGDHRAALLKQLASDKHRNVRQAVAGNVSTPVGVLEQLAADKNANVRRAVVENVNTPVGVLERLATDKVSHVRLRVAGNVRTPVGVLERLATDEDWRVRRRVARNVRTPVGVLERLATDEDQGVRTAVWSNAHASQETRVMAALLGVSTDKRS